jgi:hypothetical protein
MSTGELLGAVLGAGLPGVLAVMCRPAPARWRARPRVLRRLAVLAHRTGGLHAAPWFTSVAGCGHGRRLSRMNQDDFRKLLASATVTRPAPRKPAGTEASVGSVAGGGDGVAAAGEKKREKPAFKPRVAKPKCVAWQGLVVCTTSCFRDERCVDQQLCCRRIAAAISAPSHTLSP